MKLFKVTTSNQDQSKKYLWQIEGVPQGIESGIFRGIGGENRVSLTVSVQNGCFLHVSGQQCSFCLTGQQNFFGSLSSEQIVEQIVGMLSDNLTELSTENEVEVAFMGMGEPTANYNQVKNAILISQKLIKEKFGINLFRYIFATSGNPAIIKLLTKDILDGVFQGSTIKLHLSIHSPNDLKRNLIMPINSRFPMQSVLEAATEFGLKLNQIVNINYILFNNFKVKGEYITTATIEDLSQLLSHLDKKIFKIILCEYNDAAGSNDAVSEESATSLCSFVKSNGFRCNTFGAFGKSINLACGQLSGKLLEEPYEIKD